MRTRTHKRSLIDSDDNQTLIPPQSTVGPSRRQRKMKKVVSEETEYMDSSSSDELTFNPSLPKSTGPSRRHQTSTPSFKPEVTPPPVLVNPNLSSDLPDIFF